MRFFLTFFALFTPLACLLWMLAGDTPASLSLDAAERPSQGEPVFDTSNVPQIPVSGEIQRLEEGLFQRFDAERDYVLYYVSFRGIEKVEGKSRVVGIRCAVFGEPVDGRENLVARMEAPYLEGDPAALLAVRTGQVRQLVLGGGVRVYDGLGRLAGELGRVTIDLDDDSVKSDDDVFFRSPEKDAELRGEGLVSDLSFTKAKLLRNVRARLPIGGDEEGAVTLSSDGTATLERDPETGLSVVTMRDGARIEHPDVSGTCGRITAQFVQKKREAPEVREVVLDSDVVFEFDARIAKGIEEFRAERITIRGRSEVIVEGGEEPVRAVLRERASAEPGEDRRGALSVLGLADRTLDIATPRIEITLRPEEGEEAKKDRKRLLDTVRFPAGIEVRDRDGPGRLDARWLEYDALGGRFEAKGEVVASAVGRKLEAERIEARRPPDRKDVLVVGVFGRKLLTVRATGRLGPLARGDENEYRFRCAGPLYVERFEDKVIVRADEAVEVLGREKPVLSAARVIAVFADREVRRVEAHGRIEAEDPETGARLACDRLDFTAEREQEVLLRGDPASISQQGQVVRAASIRFSDSGRFRAEGAIDAEVPLRGQRWRFSGAEAWGVARPGEKGPPEEFHAKGDVVVVGPEGERLEAATVDYARADESLVLTGSPALIRQGTGLRYEGPSLRLRIVEKEKGFDVETARAGGPTKLAVEPAKIGRQSGRIARWEIDLAGAAHFEGSELTIPDGAAFRGYDGQGKLVLRGTTKRTVVGIARTKEGIEPRRITCTEGLTVETRKGEKRDLRFEARSLDYALGTRQLDLVGPGRMWRADAEEPTRFREAELELTDEGIKLKYLGGLEPSTR